MSFDPTSYQLGKNDALLLISKQQGELDAISDFPMASYALDVLETLYRRIDALSRTSCHVCGGSIKTAELCEKCAEDRDFHYSCLERLETA